MVKMTELYICTVISWFLNNVYFHLVGRQSGGVKKRSLFWFNPKGPYQPKLTPMRSGVHKSLKVSHVILSHHLLSATLISQKLDGGGIAGPGTGTQIEDVGTPICKGTLSGTLRSPFS